MKHNNSVKGCKVQVLAIGMGLLVLGGIIPFRLAIAHQQAPSPQAILILEGNPDRIRFAAQFAKSHPALPIWVSGNPEGFSSNQAIFRAAGILRQQVYYDFCATDTVTNFTCNADTFAAQKIQHIYVITSDYHMPRSLAIAAIVLGSRGIWVTPVAVASEQQAAESPLRIARDCLRSTIWLLTGFTGAGFRR